MKKDEAEKVLIDFYHKYIGKKSPCVKEDRAEESYYITIAKSKNGANNVTVELWYEDWGDQDGIHLSIHLCYDNERMYKDDFDVDVIETFKKVYPKKYDITELPENNELCYQHYEGNYPYYVGVYIDSKDGRNSLKKFFDNEKVKSSIERRLGRRFFLSNEKVWISKKLNKPQVALQKLIDNNKKLWEKYDLNVNSGFVDGKPKDAIQGIVIRNEILAKPFGQTVDILLWCDIAREQRKPRFCFSIDLNSFPNKIVAEYACNEKFAFNLFDSDPDKWKYPWNGKEFFNILDEHKKKLVFEYEGKKIKDVNYGVSFIPDELEYNLIKDGLNEENGECKCFSYYFEENEVEEASKDFFENILPNLKEVNVPRSVKKYTPPETEVKREIEKTAVKIASNYYAENGYSVKSVENENLGWDLIVLKNEEELHVEVKGTSRNDYHFFLSKQEHEKMKEDSKWRLFVVKDALGNPEHKEILNSDIEEFFDLEPFCFEGSWKTSGGKE